MRKLSKHIAQLSLAVLAVAYASVSVAQDNANKTLVYQQAKKYAESVACNINFDDKDRPVQLFPFGNTDAPDDTPNYAVLWIGDRGCLGGTGTSSYILSTFEYAPLLETFLLNQPDVFDEINKEEFIINTRFIDRVTAVNATTLAVQSRDFAKGDIKPSLQRRYLLRYDEASEQWQLQNTTSAQAGQNATDNQQAIKAIRSRYQTVNADIEKCLAVKLAELEPMYGTEPADTVCPYYYAELRQNQRNKPVAAIGRRIVSTQFWFDNELDEAGEATRVHKVNQTEDVIDGKISREYLYDENNNLIFYYKHDPVYDKYDTRLYFHNGKLIKALPKDFSESVDAVLRKAKSFVITAEF